MRSLKAIIICLSIFLGLTVEAKNYHIDPASGNDQNTGTYNLPWKSLLYANSVLQPGDTLFLNGGNYIGEKIEPQRSGKSGNPIVYKSFGDKKPIILRVDTAINLRGKSYIVIDGIHINGEKISPHSKINSWVVMDKTKHCVIRNCDFRFAKGWSGIHLNNESDHNWITDNYFDYCGSWDTNELWNVSYKMDSIVANDSGDLLFIQCGRFNLIENNVMKHGGHDMIVVDDSYNIIRNNVFDNNWSEHAKNKGEFIGGRAAAFTARQNKNCSGGGTNPEASGGYNLIENNVFTGTGWFPDAYRNQNLVIKVNGVNQIFRFNRIGNNIGAAISIGAREVHPICLKLKIYNNVVYNNSYAAFYMRDFKDEGVAMEDIQCVNNIFFNNRRAPRKYQTDYDFYKDHDIGVQLRWLDKDRRDNNNFRNNLVFNPSKSANVYVAEEGDRNTLGWYQSNNSNFTGNIEADPLFVSDSLIINNLNSFVLQPKSPAIDGGAFLTKTTDSGNGMHIKVEEAGFFFAPVFTVYQKEMKHKVQRSLKGDLVQIGSNPPAQIIMINYDTNEIVIDREISWKKGEGVSLSFKGKKPDIGLFEN